MAVHEEEKDLEKNCGDSRRETHSLEPPGITRRRVHWTPAIHRRRRGSAGRWEGVSVGCWPEERATLNVDTQPGVTLAWSRVVARRCSVCCGECYHICLQGTFGVREW
jgi:hypothetical protein